MKLPQSRLGRRLELWSRKVTEWTGSSWAFALAALVIVVWLATGPLFHFSDTWQLVINTGTTIVTFLMVFLIQRAQNKDSLAIQLKLNEIVAAISGASNRLIGAEQLSEEELARLAVAYQSLMQRVVAEGPGRASRSVEEEQLTCDELEPEERRRQKKAGGSR